MLERGVWFIRSGTLLWIFCGTRHCIDGEMSTARDSMEALRFQAVSITDRNIMVVLLMQIFNKLELLGTLD